MRRWQAVGLSLVLLLFCPQQLFPQSKLQIHHIAVGQGDCALIISPAGKTVLIDAGNNGKGNKVVLPYLHSRSVLYLDYVIASHYDADHIGGLDEVIQGLGSMNIGDCCDRGTTSPPGTVTYSDYATWVTAAGRFTLSLGQTIDLGGGASLRCLAVNGSVLGKGAIPNAKSSENDLSAAFLLDYNNFEFFTGGDCGGESSSYADLETPLAPIIGDIDAFKVNHHGSAYSTNQFFVNTIRPEVAIIQVGSNSYGHPVQSVLNRLALAGAKMYLTEVGSGGILPDGSGWIAGGPILLETTGFGSYEVNSGYTTHTYPLEGKRTSKSQRPRDRRKGR